MNESAWIYETKMTGFGKFPVLVCGACGKQRQQIPLNYCANCGTKMENAPELEEGKT